MAKLGTSYIIKAHEEVMAWAPDVENEEDFAEFQASVRTLIQEVKNETELALMRGVTLHLGEKHMLLTSIHSALSLCCRPIHREAAYNMAKDALDKYLGVEFPPLPTTRPRRKLLPHV